MAIFFTEPKNANNALTGTFTNIDAFYARGTNLTSLRVAYGGTTIDTDLTTAPATIFRDDTGDTYEYVLFRFLSKVSNTFTVTFNSSAVISQAYFLESLFEFGEEFMKIDMGYPERGAVIQEDLYYNLSKVKGYFKRRVGYTAEAQEHKRLREFEVFRMSDDAVEFMFLEDFEFFPERLYKALLDPEFDSAYNVLDKNAGLDLDFVIRER